MSACRDVTWKQQGELYGPVDTYVYFFNQCTAKNLTLLVTRLPDGTAHPTVPLVRCQVFQHFVASRRLRRCKE